MGANRLFAAKRGDRGRDTVSSLSPDLGLGPHDQGVDSLICGGPRWMLMLLNRPRFSNGLVLPTAAAAGR